MFRGETNPNLVNYFPMMFSHFEREHTNLTNNLWQIWSTAEHNIH